MFPWVYFDIHGNIIKVKLGRNIHFDAVTVYYIDFFLIRWIDDIFASPGTDQSQDSPTPASNINNGTNITYDSNVNENENETSGNTCMWLSMGQYGAIFLHFVILGFSQMTVACHYKNINIVVCYQILSIFSLLAESEHNADDNHSDSSHSDPNQQDSK